jgi:hypothetical protein
MSNTSPSALDALMIKIVQSLGTVVSPVRPNLNFLTGFTVADNPGNNSTDITNTASSVGVDGSGNITPNTLAWAAGATSPTIKQTAAVSGAGQSMLLAPQAATTSGASGNLIINVGAPASGTTEAGLVFERNLTALAYLGAPNGISTAVQLSLGYGTGANTGAFLLLNAGSLFINAAGGTVRIESSNTSICDFTTSSIACNAPLQGFTSGTALKFGGSAVAMAASGTTTLTGGQQQTPTLRLSGTATADITLAIGGITGHFFLNCRGLTLSGHNLILTNGAGTVTVTTLLSAFKTLLVVDCDTTSTLSVG